MKKWIILPVATAVLIGGTAAGYKRINTMFPAREIKEIELGEQTEYQEGILISVESAKWLEGAEKEEIYELADQISMRPIDEVGIVEVSVVLENQTEQIKEAVMTDLYLESTGVGNGVVLELTEMMPERYGSLRQELEPGERKEVVYPYVIWASWFPKSEWENIQDREFWLTFSSYPVKTRLYLG